MTSLPKRGDRVRVTEATPSSAFGVGAYATLANDAKVYEDDWIHFDFETLRVSGTTWSGPVKVEILERAGECAPAIHPEFARGMRRAVQVARELDAALGQHESFSVGELNDAVEQDLLKAIDEARK